MARPGRLRRALRWGLGVMLALLAFSLFYGPFFEWLPQTTGLTRVRSQDVLLLHRAGHPPRPELGQLASAASEVERMLALEFRAPVWITLCSMATSPAASGRGSATDVSGPSSVSS